MDHLTELLLQPEPRREEGEVPESLEPAALPVPERQSKQERETPRQERRETLKTPEEQGGRRRAVWEDSLHQKAPELRGETAERPYFSRAVGLPVPGGKAAGRRTALRSERKGTETGRRAEPGRSVLEGLRRVRREADFAQTQRRRLRVSLPETEEHVPAAALDPETLDRAVERDARRYDRGFALY